MVSVCRFYIAISKLLHQTEREREQIVVVVVVFWNPVCPYRSNSIETTTFAPKSDNSQIHHIKMVSPFGPMWMWCKNRFCLAESMCLVYKIEMFDVSKMQVEKLKALPLFACVIIPFWECLYAHDFDDVMAHSHSYFRVETHLWSL